MDIDALIAGNLTGVTTQIDRAAREAGRDPASVRLVAVSKVQPADRVAAALKAGHRLFGENRVQEAQSRWPQFTEHYPDIHLHLIGSLQTNKVKEAVALFDVIETVDRPRLATALAREMDRSGRRPGCFIEVNVGDEPQKAGVTLSGLEALYRLCVDECGLPIQGLMAIPPMGQPPAPYFALLAELAGRHGLDEISMGMSADFEMAVHQGATLVRVGTAIFGERSRPAP